MGNHQKLPSNTVRVIDGEPLRLHAPSGRTYFLLADADGHKRRHYVADDEATRWLREYRLSGETTREEAEEGLSVSVLCARARAHFGRLYGPGGESRNHATALDFLAAEFGSLPAHEFGPLKLRALVEAMVRTGRWTRGTLNGHVKRVRRAFRWACSMELIPRRPLLAQELASVEPLKRGRTEAREGKRVLPVADSVVEATLPHLSRHVAAMVQLQRLTGARPGEICRLRPCDLERSGEVWTYRPEHHKRANAGESREVYIGPKGVELLRPFLLRATDAPCFSPREAEAERLDARTRSRRTPRTVGNVVDRARRQELLEGLETSYSVDVYRRAIARACKRGGVPHWSPHQLRHTAATSLRSKFGIEAARIMLGHSDATLTAEVYAERDRNQALKIAKEVG